MESVSNPLTSCCPREPAVNRSIAASRTQLAAMSDSRSLDLNLVTAEGDKVTLSIDTQTSAVYGSYGQVSMEDEKGFASQWGEFSAGQYEREMTITIEGDLNRQERKEIRKVLKTLNKMMHNFVEGKVKPMMAKAGKLNGLKTIDSLEVHMAYERQTLVAQQTQVAVTYDQNGGALDAPPAMNPISEIPAPPESSLKQASESLAREMAREAASAKAALEKVVELVDRLFDNHRHGARKWNPMGARIIDNVRDLFKSALGESGQPEPAGQEESQTV